MKKKLTCLLAILLGISFAACAGDDLSSSSSTSDSSTGSESSSESSSSSSESSSVATDTHPYYGTKTATVPYTATAPTVDGTKDSLYDSAVRIEIDQVNAYYWNDEPQSLSATGWLLYDDEYIYLFVQVVDYIVDTSNDTVWRRDSLGVILDFGYYREKSKYSDSDELKADIGYVNLAAAGDFPIEYYNAYGSDTTLQEKISYATNITADGYTYELRLPVPEDFTGDRIGFEPLCIDAVNGDRIGVYSWNTDGSQMHVYTHVAGTLIFGNKG